MSTIKRAFEHTYRELTNVLSAPTAEMQQLLDDLYPGEGVRWSRYVPRFTHLSKRHRAAIRKAVAEGAVIPAAVLEDYAEFNSIQ